LVTRQPVFHLSFSICHLPSAICHFRFQLFSLSAFSAFPSAIFHLSSVISAPRAETIFHHLAPHRFQTLHDLRLLFGLAQRLQMLADVAPIQSTLVFPRKSGLRERSYDGISLVGVVGFGSSE